MPITVRLMQGNLTHDTDFFPLDRMDPYVYVSIGGERYKSTTCNQGGRNPVWGDVFTFQNSANDMMLKVEVWDRDTFTPDDLIGDGTINIMPFMNGMPSNQYVNLTYKGRNAGSILLGIQCTGGMGMAMGNPMTAGMGGMPGMGMGGMGMGGMGMGNMGMGNMGMGMGNMGMGMGMGNMGMGMGNMGMGMGNMGMGMGNMGMGNMGMGMGNMGMGNMPMNGMGYGGMGGMNTWNPNFGSPY